MPGSVTLNVPSSSYSDDDDGKSAMGYQQTLMYGRYSEALGEQIKEEAKRQRILERTRKKETRKRKRELRGSGECARVLTFIWKHTFARIGEDWVFLAMLGIIMALVSFVMDYTISVCNKARLWLVKDLVSHIGLQFLAWTSLPVFLVLFSAGFVHVVAPQAIGSGIPEMKTILRGVVLKEYLTFRTFIAKTVGLTATLGSGMPLGKEGPFVHIASIVAALLAKLSSFQGIYGNESRNNEMLAAACAVGVACCFGSPIGGVLFSIEVTTVYFAVRNYWRGFFAAVCGAVIFRLLSIWFGYEDTFVAVFRTGFRMDFPYDPQELIIFALIGVCCGVGGATYVYIHRHYVLWMRGNKRLTKFLQKNRFIYPFFISFFISCLTFPAGPGLFQAADITTHQQIEILFSNYTWTKSLDEMTVDEYDHVKHWMDPYTQSIFVNLSVYILSTFFLSILASTLPVPTGVLIPSFKIGAAFGRLIGEGMHVWFPEGIRYGSQISQIIPGGYATVGAAAFSGAVTQTISISVIVFEMTGQVTHCVPVLIAVIIAVFVAKNLELSCYDSIIKIKKLPYLPDIIPSSSGAYDVFVENFMVKDVMYIWYGMKYSELKRILTEGRKLKGFPLVDNAKQMILLGSVQRHELISAIELHISKERRLEEASKRRKSEIKRRQREERERREEEARRLLALENESDDDDTEKEAEIVNTTPKGRRPSRFAVSTVNAEDNLEKLNLDIDSPALKALAMLSTMPRKSILKKTNEANNLTIHGVGRSHSPFYSPYETVSGAERWRNTVTTMQQMLRRGGPMGSNRSFDFQYNLEGKRTVSRPDLTLEEQREWEKQEMEKPVNFAEIRIDPAPFQLVEKSNLLKVHSLFSMLGVNIAYVTAIGRLIGVVGLKELREAIEGTNAGKKPEEAVQPEDEETGSAPPLPAIAQPVAESVDVKTFENEKGDGVEKEEKEVKEDKSDEKDTEDEEVVKLLSR